MIGKLLLFSESRRLRICRRGGPGNELVDRAAGCEAGKYSCGLGDGEFYVATALSQIKNGLLRFAFAIPMPFHLFGLPRQMRRNHIPALQTGDQIFKPGATDMAELTARSHQASLTFNL